MNIVIFFPNWVGDMVMATPAVRGIRKKWAYGSRIAGIMKPDLQEILEGLNLIDEIWFYDRKSRDRKLGPAQLIRKMRRFRPDLAVLLTNDRRSALISWLGRSSARVGYDRNHRGLLLTKKLVPPAREGRLIPFSTLDYYLEIAYALGCPPQQPAMELAVSLRDKEHADRFWKKSGFASRLPVVTLNSSGHYGSAKLWPEDHFSSLGRRIIDELSCGVIVLCGPEERNAAARIASKFGRSSMVSLAQEDLSLGFSKAVIQKSSLLVTTDSGPRHFGAALGIPVISLFGPTHIAWSDTHYNREIRLQIPVNCGPCQKRECPEGHHRCMKDLSVESVFQSVKKTLAGDRLP